MLVELTVRNFALIEALRLDLRPGYTVLTGETGAGKSIIVDALNAALGERVGSEVIRGGSETCLTEAVFDASDVPAALMILADNGLADDGDETVILSREIGVGKSRYRINRRASTLSLVAEVSRHLADIHGQHQHQMLIHEDSHLRYLDQFGDRKHLDSCEEYAESYGEFTGARRELRSLQMDEQERARRLDMLRFQVEEIEAASLEPGEEEELQTQRRRLQAGERLLEVLGEASSLVAGSDELELGAKDALRDAAGKVASVGEVDAKLAEAAEELERLAFQADDVARTLSDYLETVDLDPALLERVETRLDAIAGLKRKYGDSVTEILSFLENASAEAARLTGSMERLEELTQLVEERSAEAGKRAAALSKQRKALGKELSAGIAGELAQLGMAGARFEVEFTTREDADGVLMPDGRRLAASAAGVDDVRFMLSANPGEPVKPLAKVASGGELSRLMLALKCMCARGAEAPTIVFDEIDVGIGGATAQRVGEKLMALAQGAQVLCVTHLPQVANFADQHLVVGKRVVDGRTKIEVRELQDEERVAEIARMYGDEEAGAALEHAEEALAGAAKMRAKLHGS
jgi:DNA repair protein RecN (Recombination protein N)